MIMKITNNCTKPIANLHNKSIPKSIKRKKEQYNRTGYYSDDWIYLTSIGHGLAKESLMTKQGQPIYGGWLYPRFADGDYDIENGVAINEATLEGLSKSDGKKMQKFFDEFFEQKKHLGGFV